MGITKFILKRVGFGVIALFVVAVLVFVLTQVLGDPAEAILGREAKDLVKLNAKRAELNLNRPAYEQFFGWLWDLIRLEPGVSYTNGKPILDFMGARVVNSFFMVLCAAVVTIPFSLAVGSYAALRHDKAFDQAAGFASLTLAAVPEFVSAVALTLLFSTSVWHLLPATSNVRGDFRPWNDVKGMVMPVVTLVLIVSPYVVRSVRASMIEVLESDYIEMARLKGMPNRVVLWRHALPNGLGPAFQVIALNIAYLFGGIVIIERVYNYPGIGLSLIENLPFHNVPVVQFVAMLIAAVFVVANLVADVATILVTPRLRTKLR